MRTAALFLLLFINLLFLYKYGLRLTPLAGPLAIAYAILWLAVVRWADRIEARPWMLGIGTAWIAGVTLLTHIYVPLEGLNVDRWSVIASFLDALYAGDYPYAARSHLGNPPGPMPVYYLIAAPFHALGALEVLSAAGYILALIWTYRKGSQPVAGMLLLLLSPFLYWEIATRSNLLTFSLLSLWGLTRFLKRPDYLSAVTVGLLLSTRSVYALAYLVYYSALLRSGVVSIWRMAVLSGVSALAFFATFLPLVLGWPEQFWQMNPFIVQGSFLVPPLVVGLFFGMALLAAAWARRSNAAAISGAVLFTAILIYCGVLVAEYGWQTAYVESRIDISYFLFCVPFLGYVWLSPRAEREVPRRSAP